MTLTLRFEAKNEEREARSEKSDGAMEAAVYVMMTSPGEREGTAGGSNMDLSRLEARAEMRTWKSP